MKSTLWNRFFLCACVISLLTGLAMNMLNSTLAKYIFSRYGTASFSGILNAAFAIMAILARLFSGDLSDRRGRRPVIVLGCGIFALSVLGFGLFPYAALLVLFRGFQGFGYSMSTTANYAAGSDVLPESRMGEGIGYLGLGFSLAMAIGPAIALAIVGKGHYTPMFMLTTALLVLSLILGLFNRYEQAASYQTHTLEKRPFGLSRFLEKAALPATLIQLMNCLSLAAINSFIVLYAESVGITGTAMFFTCMAAAMCLTRLFSGRLTDKLGVITVIAPALLLGICGFALLIFFHSNVIFYLVGFLIGLSSGTINPVLQATAIKAAPPDRRGAATGTYQISNDLGNGLGAVLWGIIIDFLGYTATFIGCILTLTVALILLILLFRTSSRSKHMTTPFV